MTRPRIIPSVHAHAPIPRTLAVLAVLVFACGSLASAASLCVAPGGKLGCLSTITAAVNAAHPGDTIYVAAGTYKEEVVISKTLSLTALPTSMPIIDATGQPNGIFINGMSAAPGAGVANVLVSGFEVRNAKFEGILVANATGVTLTGNDVTGNNRSLDIGAGACPGIAAFETNEGDDCGEGIHLMAADHSFILRNEVHGNSGGILISDETGSSHHNLISWNYVHDNPYDCGITLASHGPATSVIPTAKVSFGVLNNTISHNNSIHNGTQLPGAGAGVGLFAPFPGTATAGNVVSDNTLRNNGVPGITMHNHASAPSPAPGINLNNNVIIGNTISGNAADTADAATSGPTGINLYSTAPVFGTEISGNTFDDESIDIAIKFPAGEVGIHGNDFSRAVGVENLGTGTINATDNWWHCLTGPGSAPCASVQGSVTSMPWLPFAF